MLVHLALPRDIDPAVGDLPGVHLLGLQDLSGGVPVDELRVSRAQLVTAEVDVQVSAMRAGAAAGQIIGLRSLAHRIADTEIARLRTHAGGGDPHTLAEAEQAIRRIVNKLLHVPSVPLKELAATGDVDGLHALSGLFDLPAQLPPTAASVAVIEKAIL